MKTKFVKIAILIFFMLSYASADNGLRCRTGTVEKLELYSGGLPKNFNKVFPELIYDEDTSLLKLTLLLDIGRKISIYDYALKTLDGKEKYRCVAISDREDFDSENWEIGPFNEKKKVDMIFFIGRGKVETNEEFLLSFDLPLGYEVPDVKIALSDSEKRKKGKETTEKTISKNQQKFDLKEESANFAAKTPEVKKEDHVGIVADSEKFTGTIEKISVNPKSFTFYVKIESGESVKICPYGIVPAEEEKLHASVGKALQNKYLGKRIDVIKTGTDRYGRIIGKMYLDGLYLNRAMIEDGFAFYSWKYAPNDPELQDVKKN